MQHITIGDSKGGVEVVVRCPPTANCCVHAYYTAEHCYVV
jgi:hypothetical protein